MLEGANPETVQGDAAPLAMVTGASSGIGALVAERLGRRGYRTILVACRDGLLTAKAKELERHAPSMPVHLDLTDAAAIEPTLGPVLEAHGPVDVLVNGAGVGLYRPFLEHGAEDHLRLMQLHYHAPAALIRLVLPGMLQRRRGHVINIASMAAKVGPWGHAAYAASKAAITTLTETLAAEYGYRGLHFSVVNPGIVATPYFEHPDTAGLWARVKRYAIAPERVADRIVRLLDRPRLEVCVPASYRVMDWLRAVRPELAHKLAADGSRPKAVTPPAPGAVTGEPEIGS